jgi:Serine proteases of the peptidase family S9A
MKKRLRPIIRLPYLVILLVLLAAAYALMDWGADPFLAYEERESKKVLKWVEKENWRTWQALSQNSRYLEIIKKSPYREEGLEQLIFPIFTKSGRVLNVWTDDYNPQGLIRQTSFDGFMSGRYRWWTLFNLDHLSRREKKTWVLRGLRLSPYQDDRALLMLSDGGSDAVHIREYDFKAGQFVEEGFNLPESPSSAVWLDADTLLVASAVGGDAQTGSGLPGVAKLWRRGSPFQAAETVFTAPDSEGVLNLEAAKIPEHGPVPVLSLTLDSNRVEYYLYFDGRPQRLFLPEGAWLYTFHGERVLAEIQVDLNLPERSLKQGSMIYGHWADLLSPGNEAKLEILFEPDGSAFVDDLLPSGGDLYLMTLENAQSRIYQYRWEGGGYKRREIEIEPMSTATVVETRDDLNFALLVESGFLSPSSLYRLDRNSLAKTRLQRLREWFRAKDYVVSQEFAVSPDQTRVPYYIVHHKDLVRDGRNPVLQYGYGGFAISLRPEYLVEIENAWLSQGGVYVLANIRGGAELGPQWHQAALGGRRYKSFEDFIAVSEDLIQKKYSAPGLIGMEGESNGGLLVGAVLVRRPDLYGAAVMNMPLLDMLRYHQMPPGSIWTAEYGDPENPADREALAAYSPYHNLKKGVDYPPVLLMSSTRDDRVNPGHARKFAKKLSSLGQPYYYFENRERGHSYGVNQEQYHQNRALLWAFLYETLLDRPRP